MTDILGIGTSATLLYQKSLATVSNNVANLHSEGYSRQEAIALENNPSQYGVHYIGTGAYLGSVKRNYDAFIEKNLTNSITKLSSHVSMLDYTNRLFDSIASESISLAPAFDQFFESAEKLSVEPFSVPMRQNLLSSADFLSARIRDFAMNLSNLDRESAQQAENTVSEINALTSQLAEVNRQLQKNTALARQPMAVLDQRDRLLKELSALIGIEVREQPNGQVDLSVRDSRPNAVLVSGDKARAMSLRLVASHPAAQVLVLDEYGEQQILLNIQGGSLAGLVSFRSDVLAPLMSQIENVAQTFLTRVNQINREGLTLDNEVGSDVFRIQRRFTVTDARLSEIAGTRVVPTREFEQEVNISIAWLGGNDWQITDLANRRTETVRASMHNNTLQLPSIGLSVQFSDAPIQGKAVIIKSELSAAHGIQLAIRDANQFAFAEQYYLSQSSGNQRPLDTRVVRVEQELASGLADVTRLSVFAGKNVPVTLTTSSSKPALLVEQGTQEFVVSFRPPLGSDAQLQLLTADFNHLLGADLSQQPATLNSMRTAAFYQDSLYVNSNLHSPSAGNFEYRGSQFFYGHKASGFTQSVAIASLTGAPGGTTLIAAGAIKMNGKVLSSELSLAAGESLSAQKIADWFNFNISLIDAAQRPDVQAQVTTVALTDVRGDVINNAVTGEPLTQEVVRFTGDQLQFSFTEAGKPADLSVLGLSTGLYATGISTERLLIYASASSDLETDLQINVPSPDISPAKQSLLAPLQVAFNMIDDQLYYDVRDDQGALLARRLYNAQRGVALPGLSLSFDRLPSAGDQFSLQVNDGAASDNRNLLKLISLSDEKLINQQTLQQYYLTMVNTVGNVYNITAMNRDTAQIIYEHAVEQKSKVAGVNLDQEAADLIRFQQAYQASAQVIQASIKLFETLLGANR